MHLFCHCLPETWHEQAAILTAGLSLRWLRDNVFTGAGYASLANAAMQAEAGLAARWMKRRNSKAGRTVPGERRDCEWSNGSAGTPRPAFSPQESFLQIADSDNGP